MKCFTLLFLAATLMLLASCSQEDSSVQDSQMIIDEEVVSYDLKLPDGIAEADIDEWVSNLNPSDIEQYEVPRFELESRSCSGWINRPNLYVTSCHHCNRKAEYTYKVRIRYCTWGTHTHLDRIQYLCVNRCTMAELGDG